MESFERAALSAGVDRSWWAGQLGVLLIGKGQEAYQAMPRGEALPSISSYAKVKKEIMYRLDINSERYRQGFCMRKKKEDKSPWILLQHLADLLEKWLKPLEVSKVDL